MSLLARSFYTYRLFEIVHRVCLIQPGKTEKFDSFFRFVFRFQFRIFRTR